MNRLTELVERFFVPIAQVLVAPIRALHMGIGHATVTGALLLGLSGVLSTWLWSDHQTALQSAGWEALARERDARAAGYELDNAERGSRPSRSALLASYSATAFGIEARVVRVENAATLVLKWTIRGETSTASGLEITDVSQQTTDVSLVSYPSTLFGLSWAPGVSITLELEQRDASGRRYKARRDTVRVPE